MKEPMTINNSTAPYTTCQNCVVRGWCKRFNGSVALPDDYALNPECGGYIMLERALSLSKIPKEYRHANLLDFTVDSDNCEQFTKIERLEQSG